MKKLGVHPGAVVAIAVVLTAVVVGPAAALGASRFSDVPEGSTHAEGVGWLTDNGLTKGCGDGTAFCAGDPVTREQLATLLHRVSGTGEVAPSVNAATVEGLAADELGFGTVHSAATFLFTAEGCPDGERRLVVDREWGASLAWEPGPCAAPEPAGGPDAMLYGEAALTAPADVELFVADTRPVPVSGGVTSCTAEPIDGRLVASCWSMATASGAEYFAGEPSSNPLVLRRLPG